MFTKMYLHYNNPALLMDKAGLFDDKAGGDREVRAVWDEKHSKWWFSATDIVRAINDEYDYVKAGNYWRWLKKKLAGDGIQLVSVTHDFKFQAPDGKQRFADALDSDCVHGDWNLYPLSHPASDDFPMIVNTYY